MVSEKHLSREEMYQKEIAEMQKANHDLMVRIKELVEENNRLKELLRINDADLYV